LDPKGKSPKGNDQFKITIKATKGAVATQNAKISIKLSKGDFDAALADEGLTNATARNKSTPVLVQLIFNNTIYEKTQFLPMKLTFIEFFSAKS
jgi:hypothetical protein